LACLPDGEIVSIESTAKPILKLTVSSKVRVHYGNDINFAERNR